MWAIDLGSTLAQEIRDADWQHWLVQCFALCKRACAVDVGIVLVQHCSHSSAGDNEAGVYESIQHLCSGFDERLLVLWKLIVLIIEVQDHIQGVLVIWYLHAEACQIKVVLDVVFIYLDEKLIALQVAEPLDPCDLLVEL